jgi:hypothetical protein
MAFTCFDDPAAILGVRVTADVQGPEGELKLGGNKAQKCKEPECRR